MRMRVGILLILAVMLILAFFGFARAEDTVVTVSFPDWVDETQLDDDYITRKMPNKIRLRGVRNSGDNLKGYNKNLYDALKSYIEAVADGTLSSTVFEIPADELFTPNQFTAEDIGVESIGYRKESGGIVYYRAVGDFYRAQIAAFKEELDFPEVLHCLMTDCPYDLYWFRKSYKTIEDEDFAFEMKVLSDLSAIVIRGTFNIMLHVSEDYAVSSEGDEGTTYSLTEADPSYGQAVQSAAANAQAILNEHSGKGDYEKLCAYRDEICGMTSYNEEAGRHEYRFGYGNPWQLIWVFDGDPETKVVCEGYAKAFQYLCDMSVSQAVSIICQGYLNRMDDNYAHMWNVVTMGGRNYLVDLTNHEANQNLFMVGAVRGSVADGYTTGCDYTFYYNRNYTPWPDKELTLCRWDYVKTLGAGEISLPAGVKEIEAEAFANTPVKCVRVPRDCERIGERAFAGSLLGEIHIAGSGTEIAENAFSGVEEFVTIYAGENSIAHEYATRKGIRFVSE